MAIGDYKQFGEKFETKPVIGDDIKSVIAHNTFGRVVIERGTGNLSKVLSITCPRCGAPRGQVCNKETHQICAERVVALFVKESEPLVGPFEEERSI
jgi:hypothetical protein